MSEYALSIEVVAERFATLAPFTISRGSRSEAAVLTVTVSVNGKRGRGECVPYERYSESLEGVTRQIQELEDRVNRDAVELTRSRLLELLPAGAARNGIDCALWDLEAKRAGVRAWELAEIHSLGPEISAYTISLDAPEQMGRAAARSAHRPLLKVKLGGEEDLARLESVRRGAPRARLIADANEAWNERVYEEVVPHLVRLGVVMIEQPFPAAEDGALALLPHPVPVCADESCHTRSDLQALRGKYDMINIKLDKSGGLTEALLLKREAAVLGFQVMVGCMLGSSLSMAPALVAAQGAAFADLDAPLLLAEDRSPALLFDEWGAHPPPAELWG